MDKNRFSEWADSSNGLRYIDMLLIGNAQGLGLLDVELIHKFSEIKISSQLEEDRLKKLRHITLSELWVMGTYELIRLINEIIPNNTYIFSDEAKRKLKEVLTKFTEVRIPLVKFKEMGKYKLYSGVAQFEIDSLKGIGWKIYFPRKGGIEKKIFYRKDLGDSLLELFKQLKEDISIKQDITTN